MGLFGMDIPPEFGGPDIDLVTRTLLAIEMAQHRAGLYVPCYGVFGGAGLAQLFEATEDQKKRYLYPTLAGEKKDSSAFRNPLGDRTQPEPFRPLPFKMAMTGSSMAANSGSVAPTARTMDWYSRALRQTEGAAASPALSLIPTPLDSTFDASSTLFGQPDTPPSSNSRTCGFRARTFWENSTKVCDRQ